MARIAVIGAGIVGASCALWLTRGGHRVELVDGNPPGAGASSGNACTIAEYGCVPINQPDLFLRLPKLWGGAFRISPIYAARNLAWFVEFLKHCRRAQVAKITAALGALLARADDGLNPLLAMAKCQNLLDANGCLFVYRNAREYQADEKNLTTRRECGVSFEKLSGDEVRELEPNLKLKFARGVLFDRARSVRNPQKLVEALVAAVCANGGNLHRHHAAAVDEKGREKGHGVEVRLVNRKVIGADKVVIAAGAFSRQIAVNALNVNVDGDGGYIKTLPLDVERGYHIQFADCQHLASRPIHWVGSGFYAVPTDSALRFAGTVEFAGITPRKNKRTLNYITRTAAQMFDLPAPTQTWLGFRPTFPDALPVIGHSRRSKNILLAFGHHHLGLTLGGITGMLISQLIDGKPPAVPLAPYRPDRFTRPL